MKTIDLQIGKLEHQFGTAAGRPQLLLDGVQGRLGTGRRSGHVHSDPR
jgi:hypothetical protein